MSLTIPDLPSLSSRVPLEIRRAIIALHTALAASERSGGIVLGDDVAAAVAAVVPAGSYPSAVPGAVLNARATGAFNMILLEWDAPNDNWQVAYTEVFRATVDDSDVAELITRAAVNSYPDTPPDSRLSVPYYYWFRFVNAAGAGPLNAIAGTVGHTADEPGYVLENLVADKWKASTEYSAGDTITPVIPDGKALRCTVDGITDSTEPEWPTTVGNTVVDGGATWELVADDVSLESLLGVAQVSGVWSIVLKALFVGDATITNAMIKEIAADKITAGIIAAALTIIGSMLRSADGLFSIDMGANKELKIVDAVGDYVEMTPAELNFIYNGATYKSVKRIEIGEASSGDLVPIVPPFKTIPKVICPLRSIITWDESVNSNYDQGVEAVVYDIKVDSFRVKANQILDGGDQFIWTTNYGLPHTAYPPDIGTVRCRVKVENYKRCYWGGAHETSCSSDSKTGKVRISIRNATGYKSTDDAAFDAAYDDWVSMWYDLAYMDGTYAYIEMPYANKWEVKAEADSITAVTCTGDDCVYEESSEWLSFQWDTEGQTVQSTGETIWLAIEGGN